MPSPDIDQSEHKQQHDQGRRPLSVATDNMMLEFYKKDGYGAKCIHLLPTSLSFSLSSAAHASSQASDSCSHIIYYYIYQCSSAEMRVHLTTWRRAAFNVIIRVCTALKRGC